jgi:precorrin-6B C5,15-methyltransferase / cobalt-precorrin-6B C5,C15-methyltransferase
MSAAAVTVIGCDGGPLPARAGAALASASLIIGARRHLDVVVTGRSRETQLAELRSLDTALDQVRRASGPVAVLASGDPGFFGIVRALRAGGIRPEVIPAVSSVALAFARLGLDWDDALVLSAHGRDPRPVAAAALAHPKAAVLTAPGEPAVTLAAALRAAGRRVFAAERLGTPDERVAELDGPAAPADPHVLISVDPAVLADDAVLAAGAVPTAGAGGGPGWVAGHRGAPDGWALPEDDFEYRDAMITKAEVRALVLARLGPGLGRTVWDLGSGSGSVAVECARFGASVVAIEPDPAQCDRIRRNAAAHGVSAAVRVVAVRAPDGLDGLAPPDALFAGGGDDGALAAVLRAARPARAVAALASVGRVTTVTGLLAEHGYATAGVQLQASRLVPLPGGGLRLAGTNPVFVLSGERERA